MADETVTEPVNTAAPEEQATTPAPEASAATPAPTPSPASMPKPHAPSPAAFAKKTPATKPRAAAPAAATAAYSEADVKAAEAFGRVDDNGTVFVKDGDAEREVGQFPDVSRKRRWHCTPVVSWISRPSSICWPPVWLPRTSRPVKSTNP